MKKVYYCTKKYLKSLGVKNVITGKAPVSVMNGKAVMARTLVWKNEEELVKSDFLKDTIATNGVLYIYAMNVKKFDGFLGIDDGNKKLSFVPVPKESDEIWVRIYL